MDMKQIEAKWQAKWEKDKINNFDKKNIDKKYYSENFRNAMAHYKLGIALKESELKDDPVFGLSQKILNVEYTVLRNYIINELTKLSEQIDSIITKNV